MSSFYYGKRKRGNEDSSNPYPKRTIDLELLIDQKNQEIKELKRQLNNKNKDIDSLNQRINELEEEVEELKIELKETQIKLKDVESKNNELEKKVKALQGNRNILYLGEMCRRLQQNIYRYVFPDKIPISSLVSYKIKNIENDINNSKKLTKREKKDARKRWEDLKQKFKAGRHITLIEELQSLRNASAHPEITDDIKDDVFKAAEELNKQGVFEFLASFEDVNHLIRVWAKTEDLVKKRK